MTTKNVLLIACKGLLAIAETGVTSLGTIRMAREAIARAEAERETMTSTEIIELAYKAGLHLADLGSATQERAILEFAKLLGVKPSA